jgi:hypothetical protein
MDVLDRHDLTSIISWMPHGRAFLVKQQQQFASNILPRYFNQSKYLSFTRQLNLWGFKRITQGSDSGAYYHELFLRGRPYLAMRLRRQKIKGHGYKPIPNPKEEPNFYKDYPWMEELSEGRELPPLPPLRKKKGGGEVVGDEVDGIVSRKRVSLMDSDENFVGGNTKKVKREAVDVAITAKQTSPGVEESLQQQQNYAIDRASKNILNALQFGRQQQPHGAVNALSEAQFNRFKGGLDAVAAAAGSSGSALMSSALSAPTEDDGLLHPPSMAASGFPPKFARRFKSVRDDGDNFLSNTLLQQSQKSEDPLVRAASLTLAQTAKAQTYNDPIFEELLTLRRSQEREINERSRASVNDELSSLRRGQQQIIASAMGRNTAPRAVDSLGSLGGRGMGMFSSAHHQLQHQLAPPDNLFMDRLALLQSERQKISSFHRARLMDEYVATGGTLPMPSSRSAVTSGMTDVMHRASSNAFGQGPSPQQYFSSHANNMFPPQSHLSPSGFPGLFSKPAPATKAPLTKAETSNLEEEDPVEASVQKALREANHLEEMALAQRTKAQQLALAGAVQAQNRYEMLQQHHKEQQYLSNARAYLWERREFDNDLSQM